MRKRKSRPRPDSSLQGGSRGAGENKLAPLQLAGQHKLAAWPQARFGCGSTHEESREGPAAPGQGKCSPCRSAITAARASPAMVCGARWQARFAAQAWQLLGMLAPPSTPLLQQQDCSAAGASALCPPHTNCPTYLSIRAHNDEPRDAHHREAAAERLLHLALLERQRVPRHAGVVLLRSGDHQWSGRCGFEGFWSRDKRRHGRRVGKVICQLAQHVAGSLTALLAGHDRSPQTAAGCGRRTQRGWQSPRACS